MKISNLLSHLSMGLVIPVSVALLFPSPWMPLGWIGALGVYALRWLATAFPLPVSRANLPILILLTMTTIGLGISPAPDLAVITAAQVMASLMIFFVLFDWIRSPQDLWTLAALVVLLGIALAFIAPFTTKWIIKLFGLPAFYDEIWPRIGKETNPNIMAGALVPIVPLSLALIEKGDRRLRGLGALAFAPLVIITVLLQSRGALFALAVGMATWAALHWRQLFPLLVLVLAATLIANSLLGGPPVTQFLYGTASAPSGVSFVQRQDMWFQSIYLIRQSPIFGIGLNAYSQIAPFAWPYSATQPGLQVPHVHNLFLQVALDTGVIGLAAFVVLIALAVRTVWQAYRASTEKPLAIGLLSAFAVLLTHGLGDVVVWGTAKSSVILWILLAMAFAFDKAKKTM